MKKNEEQILNMISDQIQRNISYHLKRINGDKSETISRNGHLVRAYEEIELEGLDDISDYFAILAENHDLVIRNRDYSSLRSPIQCLKIGTDIM
jgi:hypothetical protein